MATYEHGPHLWEGSYYPPTKEGIVSETEAHRRIDKYVRSVDIYKADKIAERAGMKVLPRTKYLPSGLAIIYHPMLTPRVPGLSHGGGSLLEYFFDGEETEEGDVIFGAEMGPNGHSSDEPHEHLSNTAEDYFVVSGKGFVNGLEIPGYGRVLPGVEHPFTTKSEPVVALMLLTNAGSMPKHLWHAKRPDFLRPSVK